MKPLPADLQLRFGSAIGDVRQRSADEWSSSCPKCGGARGGVDPSDRFRMWDRPGQSSNFWCRRCGYQGFADDNRADYKPDPIRIKQLDELRAQQAAKEEARLRAKIKQLQREAYWNGWHDAMGEQHRAMWRREGIPDSLQDYFRLGFVKERTFYQGEEPFTVPAMTIPVFDIGWEAVNVQYRMINPPPGVGKYRFTAGLPAPLFITDPDEELTGRCILVEGAKKAIILFAHLGHKYKVVAVPSKTPAARLIKRLDNCSDVYITLDPDAYTDGTSAQRVGRMLGDRARYVRLPAKPDDLIVQYGVSGDAMIKYFDRATRVA